MKKNENTAPTNVIDINSAAEQIGNLIERRKALKAEMAKIDGILAPLRGNVGRRAGGKVVNGKYTQPTAVAA